MSLLSDKDDGYFTRRPSGGGWRNFETFFNPLFWM